jgi:hypothetical protein
VVHHDPYAASLSRLLEQHYRSLQSRSGAGGTALIQAATALYALGIDSDWLLRRLRIGASLVRSITSHFLSPSAAFHGAFLCLRPLEWPGLEKKAAG